MARRIRSTSKYMARALSLPGSALLPAILLAWGLGWPYQTLVGPGIQWEVRGPCSVTLYLASASTELLLALPHLLISSSRASSAHCLFFSPPPSILLHSFNLEIVQSFSELLPCTVALLWLSPCCVQFVHSFQPLARFCKTAAVRCLFIRAIFISIASFQHLTLVWQLVQQHPYITL